MDLYFGMEGVYNNTELKKYNLKKNIEKFKKTNITKKIQN